MEMPSFLLKWTQHRQVLWQTKQLKQSLLTFINKIIKTGDLERSLCITKAIGRSGAVAETFTILSVFFTDLISNDATV